MLSLKRNFSWMLGSKIVVMAFGLLTGGLINRALGPSGRGFLAEMQTWIGLFAVIFGLSIEAAIYHFANKDRYGSDDSRRFATTFYLSIIYSLLSAAALSIFVIFWPERISEKMTMFLLPLNILLITTMLAANMTILFQALGDIRFAAILGLAQGGLYVLLIGSGYIIGAVNLWYVLLSLIAVQVMSLLVIFNAARKARLTSGGFSKELAKGIIRAGMKQHLATISTFVYMKINQLIVFHYFGAEEAGIFAVPLNLAFAFMFIPNTFQTALYPRVIHQEDDFEVTVRSLRVVFYGWGAAVLAIAVMAKPILLVYGGGQFIDSVGIFRIMMIAAWILPLSSLAAPYIIKKGAFTLSSLSAVILGVISIVLNLVLVPRFSGMGAALATAMTCAAGFIMVLILLWYLGRRNPLAFLAVNRGI